MNEEKKTVNALDVIRNRKSELEAALPKHLTADKMLMLITSEFRKTPRLQECSNLSLINSIIQASYLGLSIGGALGECFLVPYGKECQFQLGYKGMLALAYRSDRILSVNAHCVYKNDLFSFRYGSEAFLHHEPIAGDRGELTAVYAEAKMAGNNYLFNVLYKNDVDKAKAQSKTSKYGPWVTHYDEMAMKTAIRRLFKYLPISIEMQKAIALDEAADDGRQAEAIDAECESVLREEQETEAAEQSKSDKLSDLL